MTWGKGFEWNEEWERRRLAANLDMEIARQNFLASLPPGYWNEEGQRIQRELYRAEFRRKYSDFPDGEPANYP